MSQYVCIMSQKMLKLRLPNLSITIVIIILFLFFNCIIKLHHFDEIRLHNNSDHNRTVHNSNNYIIYKRITYNNLNCDKMSLN